MTPSPPQAGTFDSDTPVISGMGCRVPGARGPERMWQVLRDGICTIGTLRARNFDPGMYHDPFQNRRGKTYSLASGQLEDIYQFDANFFGISPREASLTDPQQRMMLQAVWEAIEDAGLSARDLAGPRTGVFVGSSIVESLSLYYADTARAGSSFSLGNTLCIIANRVSSFFDFGGPSYVLDAACASSLYALHQASEAIRTGQVDTAIVGGVHALLSPGGFVGFSQARMMSPTGLCRTFDADADGYVRSEACVALVLQHPKVARRMMARRRASLLATGVNTDGAASQLTVPSAPRQEVLLDDVMLRSGRDPDDLAFYEAHGTGTQVGDPVEARSIGNAISTLRREPLLIGSAKTNFGHAEPAAGLVGLAKTLLAMEHRALPASLHFRKPNPNIDFEGLNLSVNTRLTALPDQGRLVAGLNSFGFGGTNVAAIVETDAPDASPKVHPVTLPPADDAAPWLLISAASQASLDRMAAAWAERLRDTGKAEALRLCASAAARPMLAHRMAVRLDGGIGKALTDPDGDRVTGTASFENATGVLAFPGNGAQIPGMGVAQYRDDPVFRQHLDLVASAMSRAGLPDLIRLMHAEDLEEQLTSPLVAQPLLFGFQVASARSLMDAGLKVDAVIGHSVGEIAALHIAGCFDLDAAAQIIMTRSRAFEALRGTGTMAVVAAAEADVLRAISGLDEPDLAIAAVNSPRSVTVSGPSTAISRLARVTVAGKRLPIVRLKIQIPYHSPLVEPLRDRFISDLAGIAFTRPQMTVGSTTLGRVMKPGECGIDYLWHNARDAVRFADALTDLAKDRPCHVTEVAPTPVLQGNIRDISRFGGVSLDHFMAREDAPQGDPALQVARAWAAGVPIRTERLGGIQDGVALPMPGYAWDEQDYHTQLTPDGLDAWGETGSRLLVGRRAEVDGTHWAMDLTPTHPAWIADHKVGGNIVVAGAVLVEMAMDAATEIWPGQPVQLVHFDILAPTVVEGDGVRLRTEVDRATGALSIKMRPRLTEGSWLTVARGVLRSGQALGPLRAAALRGKQVEADDLYDFLRARGLDYGPAFARMSQVTVARNGSLRVVFDPRSDLGHFVLDPTALDGAFHGLAAIAKALLDAGEQKKGQAIADRLREGAIMLPTRIGHLQLLMPGAKPAQATLRVTRQRQRSLLVRIELHDQDGACIAVIDEAEFTMVRLDAASRIAPSRLQHRRIRMRAPGQAVQLPRGWQQPARIIARMADPDGASRGAVGRAVDRLRAALPDGDVEHALQEAIGLNPDLADDLRATMIAAQGEDPRDTALFGVIRRTLWAQSREVLGQLLRRWPGDQRLSLLLVGLPDLALLQQLNDDPRLDGLQVTASSAAQQSLLTQVLPPEMMPLVTTEPEEAAHDLALIVGSGIDPAMISRALAPGGLAIALDGDDLMPARDVVDDWPWGHFLADEVPLIVRAWKAPVPDVPQQGPDIRLKPAAPMPDDLPQGMLDGLLATTGKPTHRLITLRHRPGDDIGKALVWTMAALRPLMGKAEAPILILALDPEEALDFPVLSAGLRSIAVTAANEGGDRNVRLLTVTGEGTDAAALARLIVMTGAETSAHAKGSSVWADRLEQRSMAQPAAAALALSQRDMGRLDSLHWAAARKTAPREGEVEVQVQATGLNFRDVMSARGLLSERILDAGASGAGMGMEYAGVVTRAGAGTGLHPGMPVMGFGKSAFATHLVVPANSVSAIPAGLGPMAAAGLPVAFVTAWEALRNLAMVQPGETVLIHGGAGGVGLAAIQIARMAGAEVFATAGTPEKRALAQAYGASRVFSSRDLDFVAEIRQATNGRGVDVVLNSLSGEAMQRSVECLAPFGRFVELGKRDYLEGTAMDLRPFARNLTYFGMDLDQRLAADPDRVAAIMHQIREGFESGQLRPIPVTAFPAQMTEDAFRHMLAARHTGKIVIKPPRPKAPRGGRPIRDAWIILGGTGGLGLAMARWLLAEGATAVHLVSRSGEIRLGSGEIGRWARAEARLSVHALDAADSEALAGFLTDIQADGARIGGVIHAAMVLRDRLLQDLDQVEAAQVVQSKLGVATALAVQLRSGRLGPDHVVFFSSIAAYLGNPGQVSYSAANSAICELGALLRDEGYPVRTLGWGAVNDAGYLTRNAAVALQLSKMEGVGFISTRDLLTELKSALRQPPSDHVFAPILWTRLAAMLPGLRHSFFQRLVASASDGQHDGQLVEKLRKLEWPAALALVEAELRSILSGIMRLPPDQFDPHRPFNRYGIDSLMAMELRMEVEQRFGTLITSFSINEDMTASRLAAVMVERIRADDGEDAGNNEEGPI